METNIRKSRLKIRQQQQAQSAIEVQNLGDVALDSPSRLPGLCERADPTKSQSPTHSKYVDTESCSPAASKPSIMSSKQVAAHMLFLHTDDLEHVLAFLDRQDMRNLAFACKTIRQRVSTYVLVKAHVFRHKAGTMDMQELTFSSWRSYELLNPWWRYGEIFKPVHCVRFTLQRYHLTTRNRCIEAMNRFFWSLPKGMQHIHAIDIHFGVTCGGRKNFKLDESLLSNLLHSLHRSGCSSLAVTGMDIDISPSRMDKTLLTNRRGQCSNLKYFALDTSVLITKDLSPWVLAQLSNGSSIEALKISCTACKPDQLDILFCYFDIPHLQSIVVSDVWFMTLVELLRFCPKVHTVRFHELSPDTRISPTQPLSLPNLTFIEGTAGVLGAFLPLLCDIRWDNLHCISLLVDKGQISGSDSFDTAACLSVLAIIANRSIKNMSFVIRFPALMDFTLPFFNLTCNDFLSPGGNINLRDITIRLSARTAEGNGNLLVSRRCT